MLQQSWINDNTDFVIQMDQRGGLVGFDFQCPLPGKLYPSVNFCFVPKGDTRYFLRNHLQRKGESTQIAQQMALAEAEANARERA